MFSVIFDYYVTVCCLYTYVISVGMKSVIDDVVYIIDVVVYIIDSVINIIDSVINIIDVIINNFHADRIANG
ncbi:MAG: hypothetical protein RRZ65_05325 [Tannerellaceae bacterium]